MQLPHQLIASLNGITGFDRENFESVHTSGEQVTSVRLNPSKTAAFTPHSLFTTFSSNIPWAQHAYYLAERPSFTFDPLFHAGCYYVQEASSMFLEQALRQTAELSQPLKVLDLCAAPGGKSTHLLSLLSKESLVVSNEVIRSRVNILKDNIIKWGNSNAVVTHNDPRDFAALPGYFDVIVIDAPCSGSGLFRRDPETIVEWSPANVQLCSQRQQRILADVWPALKENGILVYSTCSYSREEDEEIVNWLMNNFPVASCPLSMDKDWNIIESGGGYRFWPDKIKGEGFFLACLRKNETSDEWNYKIKNRLESISKNERAIVANWLKTDDTSFVCHDHTVYAWPARFTNDFSILLNHLRVIYSGTVIGELLRDKLVPHHALAMSLLISEKIGRFELDYENAIQYLKRKDIKRDVGNKGWQMVTYKNQPLGWMNVLSNRINNYYPKELRILQDNPHK